MPAEPTVSFEDFIAKIPDAPSSAHVQEPAADAEDPLAGGTKDTPPARSGQRQDAADGAEAPPREPKTKSAARAKPDAPAVETPSKEPDLDAVRQALKAGDLDTLGELLGEDPALYDEKTPKWAATKRKEAKLVADRDRVVRQAETVVQRWSPVSRLVEAIPTEPASLFELVTLLTGQDPDQAWTAALRARGSVDPRVPVLTRTVAEKEAQLTELQRERSARADAAFYETLRDEVDSKHVVRQIDEWESKVATTLRDSLDPDTGEPKLSTKQAADRVVRREREEYERRAKVFGSGDAPAARAPRARAPERAARPAGAKVRKLSRDEWLAERAKES